MLPAPAAGRPLGVLLLFLLGMICAGCGEAQDKKAGPLLVLGDSLSSAYGMAVEQGWVALLERRLQEQGYNYPVHNASISGDTSQGALRRLPALLEQHRPAVVIVEIGGNDGLRGLPVLHLRRNLERILDLLDEHGSRALLVSMRIPPNYGAAYSSAFADTYAQATKGREAVLGRFFLDGVAQDPRLMQQDGIHPRAEAQQKMLENVWPDLQPLL